MRAYDESYLADAQSALGEMMDHAAVDCGHDPDEFWSWFLASGVAESFGRGNPRYVAGMSGVELAREVGFRVTGERSATPPNEGLDWGAEYWCGWVLAYSQWSLGVSFSDLARCGIVPSWVMARYVYHETDPETFASVVGSILANETPGSALAAARRHRRLTQQELAEAAGVSLRMVQLYEQGQSDLSRASVSTVLHLAHVLGVDVETLI